MKFDEITKLSIEVKSNYVCIQSNVSLLVYWCLHTLRQEREIAQRTTTTITKKSWRAQYLNQCKYNNSYGVLLYSSIIQVR